MSVGLPTASKEEREKEEAGPIKSCKIFENTVRKGVKQVASDSRSIVN